jgi:hypothetical protein
MPDCASMPVVYHRVEEKCERKIVSLMRYRVCLSSLNVIVHLDAATLISFALAKQRKGFILFTVTTVV